MDFMVSVNDRLFVYFSLAHSTALLVSLASLFIFKQKKDVIIITMKEEKTHAFKTPPQQQQQWQQAQVEIFY